MTPLTGTQLIDTVASIPATATRDDVFRLTGYATTKKDGTEQLRPTYFFEALLEATNAEPQPLTGNALKALQVTHRLTSRAERKANRGA